MKNLLSDWMHCARVPQRFTIQRLPIRCHTAGHGEHGGPSGRESRRVCRAPGAPEASYLPPCRGTNVMSHDPLGRASVISWVRGKKSRGLLYLKMT